MSQRRLSSVARLSEVNFGEEQERLIVKRWAKLSRHARRGVQYVKGSQKAHYDFLVLDRDGLPVCYVEVKKRRSALSQFGDCILPVFKLKFAASARSKHAIPTFAVTEYGCGALVEVDLSVKPAKREYLERRDRPGQGSEHAFYTSEQFTVLAKRGD